MKRLLYIGLFFFVTSLDAKNNVNTTQTLKEDFQNGVVATRGDIKVIEASENIRYLSQKMVKEYLFFYRYPDNMLIKQKLQEKLAQLNESFHLIVTTTKDSDTKDILDFLAYSKDQIEEIFKSVPDEEKSALMLDYSETLLEGADSIAKAHRYNFSQEEKMFMLTKEMEYLLERIIKYYMAQNVGFENTTNQEAMREALKQFEKNLQKINSYSYEGETLEDVAKLNRGWEATDNILSEENNPFIPKLMFLSVHYLENIVTNIGLYHSKNQ